MSEKKNDEGKIPFKKAVRIGNFKLWRSKFPLKTGKESMDVDCINVSNLDGSWMVRIPSTMSIYGLICQSYDTTDSEMREQFLGMLFTNQYNICTCGSEALHDSLFFLTEMLTFPYLLLSEKEMSKRMDKAMKELGYDKKRRKEHIGKMIDYRAGLYELIEEKKRRCIEDYERQQALQREYGRTSEEEDLRREDIADEAMDILDQVSDN